MDQYKFMKEKTMANNSKIVTTTANVCRTYFLAKKKKHILRQWVIGKSRQTIHSKRKFFSCFVLLLLLLLLYSHKRDHYACDNCSFSSVN